VGEKDDGCAAGLFLQKNLLRKKTALANPIFESSLI
jgi:hypothetical protein